jgi:hypothetical protein
MNKQVLFREDINVDNILTLINDDIASPLKKEMNISYEYYKIHNIEIEQKRKMMQLYNEEDTEQNGTIVNDFSKANNKLAHGYHYELVNQCKRYLAGKPVQYSFNEDVNLSEDDKAKLEKVLNIDNDWKIYNQENVKNVQIFYNSWTNICVDDTGKLRFDIIDSREIIPFRDKYNKLKTVIRYYTKTEYNKKGKMIDVQYAEVYDNKYKDIYKKISKSKYELIESEVPLLYKSTSFDEILVDNSDYVTVSNNFILGG